MSQTLYRNVTIDEKARRDDGTEYVRVEGEKTLSDEKTWIRFGADEQLLRISEATDEGPDWLADEIYAAADGFGDDPPPWDWSHIRDSSSKSREAMDAIACLWAAKTGHAWSWRVH